MESLQQILAVFFVLVLLGGTLYWLRTRGMARFSSGRFSLGSFSLGVSGGAKTRRMQTIDRLSLTPQHSLHLVRVDGRMLLIAVSPGGCSIIEGSGQEVSKDERSCVA